MCDYKKCAIMEIVALLSIGIVTNIVCDYIPNQALPPFLQHGTEIMRSDTKEVGGAGNLYASLIGN